MSQDLRAFLAEELETPAPAGALALAEELTRRFANAGAVLFYGSVLRTGDLSGIMDFYVLTLAPRPGVRGLLGRWLWPDVSYHEVEVEGRVLRAKVASMTLAQFKVSVHGRGADTTLWTRFVQPAGLLWTASPQITEDVEHAITEAAITAANFAAALGPERGPPDAYWRALFRQTYAAEFRVEASGREGQILEVAPERYDRLLVEAWRAASLAFETGPGGDLIPHLPKVERSRLLQAWAIRRTVGKPLNLARLAKAAFTFEGAARYAAWKIERHTGLKVELTPWRERHPILASPGVFWRLWKARRQA
jgi:hypothetical protein